MNFDSIKKNVGCRVQLEPVACGLDGNGRELEAVNDDWIIRSVDTDGVNIMNMRTRHITTLGKDHIHHFTSNPDLSKTGVLYGFLTLHVQVFIQENNLWVRPNSRPGESVRPLGAGSGQLSSAQCDNLALLMQRGRQSLERLVKERASAKARAEVSSVQNEIRVWLESHLGKAHAQAFIAAPPSMGVPVNYPSKFGGIYRSMRGQLTYLAAVVSKICP